MILVRSWVSLMVGLLCRGPKRGWWLHRGIPCQAIPWICEAGAAEHLHKSGFCHICALIQVPDLLLSLALTSGSSPQEHLRENPTVIQEVGDGWGTMRKAAGFCSTGIQGEGRWEQISCDMLPQPCLCFPPGYSLYFFFFSFFEGKQRALRGQREKWGVSEEREHSCEKCHSYLGNWKYFPSLPEWSFPDFNYFPIVSKKDTWPLTSFGPEEIRLSTF